MAEDAADGAGQRPGRAPIPCRNPVFGMEALDLLGIDIDQDPGAFAKFLELKTLMQAHGARRGPLRAARR